MTILKIILYVVPFLVALAVFWIGMGLGLIVADVQWQATVLVIAALLIALLNVGWIVAYGRK